MDKEEWVKIIKACSIFKRRKRWKYRKMPDSCYGCLFDPYCKIHAPIKKIERKS